MKVVILCGGLGTRLREETEFRPKPMVEIGGRPILWHIMKTYAHYGFRDFILCLGYRGSTIKNYFLDYETMNNDFTLRLGAHHGMCLHGAHDEQDFTVTLAETGADTMTGGRLLRVRKYIEADPDQEFLMTYGDGLSDVNVTAVLEHHRRAGTIATVTSVRPVSRFGTLEINPLGTVERFAEKPATDGWINAGYFVFNRAIFNSIDGDQCILERRPLEQLAEKRQLSAFCHDGFFFAMDTYREYTVLNDMWATGRAPWKIWN